jgi:tRNA (5-methylaminomethyl-2-thiouridylate)-methyltransferase
MKTAVLVSGGVDSSIALHLMKEKGYSPTAFYIKIWLEENFSICPWEEDLLYVQEVVKKLKVPLHVVSLQKEYWENIISYTFDTLKKGKTPNPDIFCNKLIKFGVFDKKFGKDFDYITTGHYSRKVKKQDKTYLKMALDKSKDQSYFLGLLTKDQLTRSLFPIGGMYKKDVRLLAKKVGLPTFSRPDSQGLCFLGKISFKDFLKKYVGEKKGKIVEKETGKILGSHNGYWFYTIGQREGLGIGGSEKPYYVSSKDASDNIVYVAKGSTNALLLKKEITLTHLNILAPDLLKKDKEYLIKLRHPHSGVLGKIKQITDNSILITLHEPAFGVTEGQFGVLYDDEIVVCCGEIS